MWVAVTDLPTAVGHPFYRRLNQVLREHGFDDFTEAQCASFYAETMGRPGLPPGIYFRVLLIGYFEGINSERGIAWRAADSLVLRDFIGVSSDRGSRRRRGRSQPHGVLRGHSECDYFAAQCRACRCPAASYSCRVYDR